MKNLLRGMKIFNLIEMWQISDNSLTKNIKIVLIEIPKQFYPFFSKIFTKITLKDFFSKIFPDMKFRESLLAD